jgi:hypothetical protein
MTSDTPGASICAPYMNDSGALSRRLNVICSEDEEDRLPIWVSVYNYIRKPLNASVLDQLFFRGRVRVAR